MSDKLKSLKAKLSAFNKSKYGKYASYAKKPTMALTFSIMIAVVSTLLMWLLVTLVPKVMDKQLYMYLSMGGLVLLTTLVMTTVIYSVQAGYNRLTR